MASSRFHVASVIPDRKGKVEAGVGHAQKTPLRGLRFESLGHGTDKLAVAEYLKVKELGRGRGPEPERIDGFAAVAHHRPIERDPNQG